MCSNQKTPASPQHRPLLHARCVITRDHGAVSADCDSEAIACFRARGAGAPGGLTRVIEAGLIVPESWRGLSHENRPRHTPNGTHLLNLFPMQFHGDYTDFSLVIEPGAELNACSPAVRTGPFWSRRY